MNTTTYAIWIGDRSGSMLNLEESHKNGYNNFIDEQIKQKIGNFYLTTIRFDDEIEFINKNCLIEKIQKADNNTFKSRGSTALYDAIGHGIKYMLDIYNDNKQIEDDYIVTDTATEKSIPHVEIKTKKRNYYVVLIMTDGFENSSKEYTKNLINNLINDCKKKDISIKFMGANQDAELTGGSFGIEKEQCMTFCPTPLGLNRLMRTVSNSITTLRSTGKSKFTAQQKRQTFKYI